MHTNASIDATGLRARRRALGLTQAELADRLRVTSNTGELARATRIFGAADALRVLTGGALWPLTLNDRERAFGILRAGLGEREFEAEWTAGRQLSMEQVLAEVMGLAGHTSAPLQREQLADARTREVPGQLSRREWEVAMLIARGLSNRQIAEALVVGERTAANHVEHIFQKLGFHSRAQVAAWATEQRVPQLFHSR